MYSHKNKQISKNPSITDSFMSFTKSIRGRQFNLTQNVKDIRGRGKTLQVNLWQ